MVTKGGDRLAPIDRERWAVDRYLKEDGPRALGAFRECRAANLAFLDAVAPAALTAPLPVGRTAPLSGLDLIAG